MEGIIMKNYIVLLAWVFIAAGCTTTQKSTATGGIAGATLGGIIGHQSDHGVAGAAIGAAVGTVGGMMVGEKLEKKFCPVGGEEYTEDTTYCPKHGVELKLKDE
jgi:uncharacterized protein YcfJ